MKHLLPFRVYEARAPRLPLGLTPDQEEFLNRYTRGTWSVNQQTGLVDVSGNFNCPNSELKSLQGVSFGHVSGNFTCSKNELTSLVGAPQTVDGNFWCENNILTSLSGAPQTVDGDFWCSGNQLTSLAGAPQTVGDRFYCYNNQLTTLAGAPQTVKGNFYGGSIVLKQGEWNPSGWEKTLSTGNDAARELILTLPYLDPAYWLELHRSNRKKFNDIWVGYRQDPEVRKTKLFQEVEAALSGRALKNLEDLQDLKDFGL